MKEGKPIKAGDPCPSCGGEFVIDEHQDPARVIERKRRNAMIPATVARFTEAVLEKAQEHGIIHRCTTCNYRSRFKPARQAA